MPMGRGSGRTCGAPKQILERHLQLPKILLGRVVGDGSDLVPLDGLEIALSGIDLLEQLADLGALDRLPGAVAVVEFLIALLDLLDEGFAQRIEKIDEGPML